MRIAAISPNDRHLQEIGRILQAHGHQVVLAEGGKSRMRAVAEREQPDMMLVDGMCCDPDEVLQIEEVTTQHPAVAVVLLCATHTPEFLINSMRAGVREVLPSPPTAQALQEAVSRVEAKLRGAAPRNRGKVLAFLPCKGGSGATFLATNLGWLLAESSSVLLLDLNLQFGDALSFVDDSTPASTLADVARDIGRLDASLLAASAVKVTPSYSVLAAPDDPSQAIAIMPEHIDAILGVAASHYDFVLLDLGRQIDTLAIKALDRATRIYPVLQAGLPHIRHATRLLEVFRSLGYGSERIELILNRYEKGGEIGLDVVQRAFGQTRIHTVPNSWREVSASINQGEPLPSTARGNAVARNLADLAAALSPRQDEGNRGLLGRLFRRA
jgi:pilus assembly protein CpaE